MQTIRRIYTFMFPDDPGERRNTLVLVVAVAIVFAAIHVAAVVWGS